MIDVSILKIDYDIPYEKYDHSNLYPKLMKVCEITGVGWDYTEYCESKNGNTHVTVFMKEKLEPLEKLFLQCWLGDDPIRCLFNFRRIRRGQKNWNILFDGKVET